MEDVADGGGRGQQEPGSRVTLPWMLRLAAAWAIGANVSVDPEDEAALEATAAELVLEAIERWRHG